MWSLCLLVVAANWYPFAAGASWFSDATGIDINLNREFGSGVSQIAGPTFDRAEKVGRTLIDEADKSMKNRLDQLDLIAQNNLGRADSLMERRLSQVDMIAARRLDQVDSIMEINIKRVDQVMHAQIVEADRIVGQRLVDVDGLLSKATHDLDTRLATRIAEIDEAVARSIAKTDIMITKDTLAFEATVRRLIATGCILVFLSAALWRLYVLALKPEKVGRTGIEPVWSAIRKRWRPLIPQIAVALVGAVAIYLAYLVMPGSPSRQLKELQALHAAKLEASLRNFDLSGARYEAAQLRLLAPGDQKYPALLQKAELVVDVLRQPTWSRAVATEFEDSISRVEKTLGRDPDLDTLAAVVAWRSGADRHAELAAATLAARAIQSRKGNFPLLPIAVGYLDNYLSDPIPQEMVDSQGLKAQLSMAQLTAARDTGHGLISTQPAEEAVGEPVRAFNERLRTTLGTSRSAYGALIRAVARKDGNEIAKQADIITASWKDLDSQLAGNVDLEGQPMSLALFELPDSLYSRACWYRLEPSLAGLKLSGELAATSSPSSAVKCAPPRVYWAKRYLSSLSRETQTLAALQEAQRAESLDRQLANAEVTTQSFYRELAGERRPAVILRTGEAAATALAGAGLASASVEVMSELRRNTGAADEKAVSSIAAKASAAFMATRSALI